MSKMPDTPEWNAAYESFNRWMANTIGMPESFSGGLATDDDWTFVIKLHSLLEAGLNHLLITHFGDVRLAKLLCRLDTGDRDAGKLAFIKAAELLPDDCRQFVRFFSEIRNHVLHDVRNFQFDLAAHVGRFEQSKRKAFRESCASGMFPTVEIDGKEIAADDVTAADPRYGIFCGTWAIMVRVLQYELRTHRNRKLADDLRHLCELAMERYGFRVPVQAASTT